MLRKFGNKYVHEVQQFMSKYNTDNEFKKDIRKKYDISPYELSLLEIFILEEIVQYGDKNIYASYIAIRDDDTSMEDHWGFYDYFRKRITTNLEFAITKYKNIEHLSKSELFIIGIILHSCAEKEIFEQYDPLNKKLVNNGPDFFETLKNHRINIAATAIYDKAPEVFECHSKGQFSKESKEAIINILRQSPDLKQSIDELIHTLKDAPVDFIYYPGLERNWDKYNTNISYDDVFGEVIEPNDPQNKKTT